MALGGIIAFSAVIMAVDDDSTRDLALGPDAAGRQSALQGVETFTFKSEGQSAASARQAAADLVIVEPLGWLSDALASAQARIATLQRKSDGQPRLLLGTLSLSTAPETNRSAPLAAPKVWDPQWRQQLFGRNEAGLDRLLASGFDGVVIEGADLYAASRAERPNADAEMVDFIRDLAVYARQRNPSFLVFIENAEELVLHRRLLTEIDGLVKTDLFYGVAGQDTRNGDADVAASLLYLKTVAASGRPVLVVEHIEAEAKRAQVQKRAASLGFRAYFAAHLLPNAD